MPVDFADPAEEEELPRRRRQFEKPSGPWYKPTSKFGRILLATTALLLIGALTAGAIAMRNALERDGRFRIAGTGNIQAAGLSQVARADILPVFGEDIGKNIFFIHLGDRRKQLEQIPWIEKATVMRILPDQIRVSVVERMPIAFVREGQQIALVDADGVLLNMSPEGMTQHHYSFPVVTGIDPRDPPASRKARMAVYQRLIGDLDSNGQHLSQQISEIDLTDPEDARVLMPEQGADILAHFGDEQFLTRYQRYKTHIAEWRQQYPRLASVDLRYDNQVVLQMAGGSGAAPAAVNADDGKPAPMPQTPAKSADQSSAGASGSKPSPANRPESTAPSAAKAVTPVASAPKPAASAHKATPEHKPQSHHAARPKSAAEREKEKREAAHKAALLHRQRSAATGAANRQEQ
jgi:cell division protein FtsQ